MKTGVIYARYSSDLQKDRSIDDQVTHCRALAERNGYKIADVFVDRAKSAASMFERDGLLALMTAAKKRDFSAVITESLSRLSRDQEDTAAIYKRLKFNKITIIDTGGEVSDVHIGVGGIVNSMFLKNLSVSVKRAKAGSIREGLVPGRIAYGYRGTGKPNEREIDPAKAKIVRRIFEEYANGKSTTDIAVDLARDGIKTPGLVGGDLFRNEIYIGKSSWNTTSSIKDPDTGRRVYRANAAEDVITTDVPHLRIIPQKLWDCVADRRTALRKKMRCHGPRRHRDKKDQMLSGLLTCGTCGGNMIFGQTNPDGSPRAVCTFGYRRINCDHFKSYSVETLEKTVLDGIKEKLTDRGRLLELTKAYHSQWAKRQKTLRVDRDETQADLNRVKVSMDRYVTAIGDSDDPVEALVIKLNKLRVVEAGLKEKLRIIKADEGVVTLHPAAIGQFATNMELMHAALSDPSGEAFGSFRVASAVCSNGSSSIPRAGKNLMRLRLMCGSPRSWALTPSQRCAASRKCLRNRGLIQLRS
jgi:site-specific DNA recombinase